MNEPKRPDEQMPSTERAPSYGLLVIKHAYNEGEITFLKWMELSREWALKIIEQYGRETAGYVVSLASSTRPEAPTAWG